VVLGAAAFALTGQLAGVLRSGAFGWWPEGWIIDTGTHPGFSDRALLLTGLMMLLGSAIVGPVVEEYYFRGYLLPRMPARLGPGAPLAHAILFAGYHRIRIGILTHIVLNTVDLALFTRYLLIS
jgi:membrane protease YdiL (CAAX protease family)